MFLDATDAENINSILSEGLARSRALVLLQTKGVLTRPFVLLELFEALRLG